ncbi:MAG: protein kinase [Cyanobacteria bacterium J06621_8]
MQTNHDSLIGKTLRGKYQVISKLAQGGQGNIYDAKDITSSIDKRYIVKQFAPTYESGSQLQKAQELFNQEAIILQKLGSHTQIPQIFDYFTENSQFFLVQEFIDGQNLQQELDQKKYLTESATIEILQDILRVLQFVHQNNYIHRDLKPSNLIRNQCDR